MTLSQVPTTAEAQPDISYHPDETKWRARTARRLAENPALPSQPLPEGFPAKLEGPIVWKGSDFTSEDQWVVRLTDVHLQEIDDGLRHFKSLNKPLGHINRETYPLPTLGAVLFDLAKELYSGRGFFVLRTIPVEKYNREEIAIIYTGISAYVGSARGKQDVTGAVIAHIKDLSMSHAHEKGHKGNTAYTTDKQVFHTDVGDLIALICLSTSEEGGTSRLCSGPSVYNEIAATRPDLIKVLAEPWPLDSFGGKPGYTFKPLVYWEDGHMIIQYTRRLLTGYGEQTRSPHIPAITEAQAEALDTLQFVAEKLSVALNFQKGDVQYINSIGLLHARDGFRDSPEKTRHLIRLWLRNDELAWKTPAPLQPNWTKLYSVAPDNQRFPLEPEVRKKDNNPIPLPPTPNVAT
ncbi:hypothetical protein AGABI2DRAFT_190826 [Agaricus bisporus var. bisporus H97]|uniref:hypothetical protein n=1 Tax=Agaricus bisporus var. bisporus (strain H97 / ATCC MYA-4626 / FGSC 10389) TaxID=936046 RepID=UPI00029F6DB3|nr:hypothetical protein AGABI2DRAFT_190826 [Agaricus bisporus var. bisporus H97]EKV50507.1 hypothetical protein AGABI2DRAFT_190826 [Agaricus bisporus var. bisporus H97]